MDTSDACTIEDQTFRAFKEQVRNLEVVERDGCRTYHITSLNALRVPAGLPGGLKVAKFVAEESTRAVEGVVVHAVFCPSLKGAEPQSKTPKPRK